MRGLECLMNMLLDEPRLLPAGDSDGFGLTTFERLTNADIMRPTQVSGGGGSLPPPVGDRALCSRAASGSLGLYTTSSRTCTRVPLGLYTSSSRTSSGPRRRTNPQHPSDVSPTTETLPWQQLQQINS